MCGCVLDGAFWNSNTPSKTQWHTCSPNGWIRQNIWHQNTKNHIKKKKKKTKNAGWNKDKDSTKSLIAMKSRVLSTLLLKWFIYHLTSAHKPHCSAWCWHEHHIQSVWKVAHLDVPPWKINYHHKLYSQKWWLLILTKALKYHEECNKMASSEIFSGSR